MEGKVVWQGEEDQRGALGWRIMGDRGHYSGLPSEKRIGNSFGDWVGS